MMCLNVLVIIRCLWPESVNLVYFREMYFNSMKMPDYHENILINAVLVEGTTKNAFIDEIKKGEMV